MAPKKSTVVLNVEQFIRDVEQRPAIWNRNFHCNKAFLEQMWDELSAQHKLPKVVLKAKWKGLRDNFRVEYKRIPRSDAGDFLVEPSSFDSKWIHYYALLFLTEHMRHRLPKSEQDQSFYFAQQSEDCEKTVVEPDLTNGLIRRLPDSDEEFDEDDVDDDEEELTQPTPPAAHSQSFGATSFASIASLTGSIIKTEDTRSLRKSGGSSNGSSSSSSRSSISGGGCCGLLKAPVIGGVEKEAQDLSKKTAESRKANSAAAAATATIATATATRIGTGGLSMAASSSNDGAGRAPASNESSQLRATPSTPPATTPFATLASSLGGHSKGSTSTALGAAHAVMAAVAHQQKIRSVSPPPLYNKAHHPPPSGLLSKERSDDFPLGTNGGGGGGGGGGGCLHGSHEHLNFTKHSYANGLIPALKLKRPRLSEDSNFNGSSTMDSSPPVPEDDDYHYLLSLHPYMKQLTAAQKLRIRTKIQKLIFKELYKEDLEETK